jgi:glycosyltransferase involved in cell wall biosynthesis
VKLLWLTPEVPEPVGSGGSIRAFHLIRGLAARGWDITVAAVAYPHQARDAQQLADAGVELRLPRRPRAQALEAVEGVLRDPSLVGAAVREPFLALQAGVFWTRLAPVVARRLAERGVDAALIEHDFAARWAAGLPLELPCGLALQNAGWRMRPQGQGLRGALGRIDDARFERYVRRTAARFSWVSAVSEEDAAAATALGLAPPVVIANGVDFSRVADVPADAFDPRALLFTGTLTYPPNAEAALWFANDVLPALPEDVSLRIVGRNPPPAVARLGEEPNVAVTGWVDDLRPELARAAVVVAPLRSGGGTKLKVVEALAAARPVVATSVGAEGIDVRDGEHLLIADTPEDFAAAVRRLLDDPGLAARIGAAGRRRVRERYDWELVVERLDASLRGWLCTSP